MDDGQNRLSWIDVAGLAIQFVEGRVFMDLWRWFIVPLGAPAVTYWQAIGFGLLIAMCARANGVERDHQKQPIENVTLVIFFWLLGWLCSFGVVR